MLPRTQSVVARWSLAVVLLCPIAVGCGSPFAQVSGVAKYDDGAPVAGAIATIQLQPTEDSSATVRKGASGQIADDGTFSLMTKKPGDGVYKGRYAVTFTVLKDPRTGESLIPAKYNRRDSTPFTVDITGSQDDLEFVLDRLE